MAKEKDVIIANQHTAPVTLPRMYAPETSGDPSKLQKTVEMVTIQPGHTVTLTATVYELRRTSSAFIYYLDHHILGIVKRMGEVDITSDSVIDTGLDAVARTAPHLLPDGDGNISVPSAVDGAPVQASVKKLTKGTVTV